MEIGFDPLLAASGQIEVWSFSLRTGRLARPPNQHGRGAYQSAFGPFGPGSEAHACLGKRVESGALAPTTRPGGSYLPQKCPNRGGRLGAYGDVTSLVLG